jgi:catechol 2,3-dioxygenase-like lactoylglutathione lyase family enzyme
MTDWLGLRHVALNVRDIARAVEFYQIVLGMRLEWQPDPDNAYLTSGPDNLALHRISDKSEPASGFQALDHIGFVVRRPEDVDAWADQIQSIGITLDTLPRTHRDGARSFYFRDPEGNRIQIIYHPPISDL